MVKPPLKVWIPLLPGYSILTEKEKVIRLTISVKDNNELEYIYIWEFW